MGMQATSKGTMPVVLLKEGGTERKGREATKNNIAAAKIIAEIVHTSLGPRGMDKMLVDSLGDVTITNDGATILKEIDVQHPAAKMLVEIAKTTDNEVGDGTTSAVILAGALLEHAEFLIDQDVHPTIIVDGYKKAARKTKEFLEEIADTVVFELRGGNTGLDVINALDASVMGPTYRGGIMRNDAMSQLNALEKQYDVHSVAFEMLGPPRLSKLLFEANLLKRIAHSLESVSSMTAIELSKKAETLIIENQSLRSEMLSVGLVILMSDGEKYLRGSDVKIPAFRGENSLEINTHSLEQWCYEGWIDLRPSNFEQWQERIIRIKKEVQSIAPDDTSSRHYYGKHYWADFNEIDEGKLAAWIFEREDKGWRFKR